MELDTPTNEPRRIQELWFEDGNIVLQAAGGSAQYKVYRGTLARQSSVFENMLAFPQPPESALVDGCPLVHLPDDDEEVTPFLRALFEPDYFLPFPARTTFRILYGCLRLGHKYDVDSLRRRALVHFTSYFRTNLDEWDESEYSVEKRDEAPSKMTSWVIRHSVLGTRLAGLIACANLAREVGATWALPTIFYVLSTWFEDLGTGLFHGYTFGKTTVQLSLQDQASFLLGSERQMRASWDILRDLSDPSVPSTCPTTPDACTLAVLTAAFNSKNICRDAQRHPLLVWSDDCWPLLNQACFRCIIELKRRHTAAREKFWNDLPGNYGLPSWPELQMMRDAAIEDDLLI
ncbi:hypothetical protein C8F01DRAFT_977092 [Mycena amicta]|nr:hypothetical protein C8F01DRAFT_977092 [Mycena amicta]